MTAPPASMYVELLDAVVNASQAGYGVAGGRLIGSQEAVFAGWVGADGGGTGAPTNFAVSNDIGGWHVTRISMVRLPAGWRTSSIDFDGAPYQKGIEAFPPEGQFSGGALYFGAHPLNAMPVGAPPVILDMSDVRVAITQGP